MEKINLEFFKKHGKKIILTKVAPIALATTIVVSTGMTSVQAANVTFDSIIITDKDNQYVTENVYSSGYVTDKSKVLIEKNMKDIDILFNKTYSLIANGAFNSSDKSLARFCAELNNNKTEYEKLINDYNYNEGYILKQYYDSKVKEIELIYASYNNIKLNSIENYMTKYNCVYANSLSNDPNVKYVAIHEMKNNQIVSTNYYTYDDTNLKNNNSIVIMPTLNVRYNNYNSTIPTFNTTYKSIVVSNTNKELIDKIMVEIDKAYENITNAISKGNYSDKEENVLVSIYGDTNLINSTINNKYSNTGVSNIIKDYLNYKQSLMVSKVYNCNYSINYLNYQNYINNNTPIRVSEENGFVYYKVYSKNNMNDYSIKTIKDKGYIKTKDLGTSEKVVVKPDNNSIKVQSGVNIYVDNTLYTPKDANGNVTKTFIYNGTVYLPIRPISKLFGLDINWNSYNNAIELTQIKSDIYYTNEKGERVYVVDLEPITNNGIINNKLQEESLEVIKGAKVYYNGTVCALKDANGNSVEVLNINGTTYLPARAICNLMNAQINYDASTHTVYIYRQNVISDPTPTTPVPGTTTESKAYYIDPVTGQKVYIEENEYTHTR